MIYGQFKDGFPRTILTLPGWNGPLEVEFVIDTGFDGEIAVPLRLLNQLEVDLGQSIVVQLATGAKKDTLSAQLVLEWQGEQRTVEVLTLDGNPLIGNAFWADCTLTVENVRNGEVAIEPH